MSVAGLVVTFFENEAAKTKREERCTSSELVNLISTATAPVKSALRWLKCARFGDHRSEKGSLRTNRNVLACTGVEADYDAGFIPYQAAVDRLRETGIEAIVYTSPSYTPATPKWRVICPFSEELPPEKRADMLGRLAGVLKGIGAELAGESWTLSQSYYFGSVSKNPAHQVIQIEGTPIDLRDDLDAVRRDKPGSVVASRPVIASDPAEISDARLDGLLQSLLGRLSEAPEQQKHHTLLRVARTIGGYAHLFGLGDDQLWGMMRDALPATVLDWHNAEKTARDGLAYGRAAPLVLEDRPRRLNGKASLPSDPCDDPNYIASLEAEAQRHQRRLSQPQPANGQADDDTLPAFDVYTHYWMGPAGNIPCTPTGLEWADDTGRIYAAVWATDEEDPTLARRSVAPADELIPATDPGAAWQAPKHDDDQPADADGADISDPDDDDILQPDGDDGPRADDQPARGSSGNGASVPEFEPGYTESLDEADEPAPPSDRVVLKITKGEYVAVAEKIEAIATAAQRPIYSHGEALCRPVTEQRKRYDGDQVTVAVLRNYNTASLRRAIDPAIGFSKFDGRRKAFVACEPPPEIINMVLAGAQKQIFPPIRGIIATPILRPDHTIVTTPGYDPRTGYYLVDPPRMPPIPAAPTKADATKALGVLKDLLSEMPFADEVSRCVAYSGLITPLVRAACDVVPGHLFTAPQQGSGKSLLLDTAAAIATGERAYAILAHRDPKEQDKQLAAAVLEGRQIIALDNLTGEIESAILAQITERERVSVRLFGTLDSVAVLNGFNTYLTGNNLTVAGDNTRRLLVSRIQPNVENPLDRTFQKQNPVITVLRARGEFVHACLTIVLAYIAQGRPEQMTPTPSFQAWSELVREPLVWLGLPDPTNSMRTAFDDDPHNVTLANLIAAWPTSTHGWTCAELIDAAMELDPQKPHDPVHPGLAEALKPIGRDRRGNFDPAVLGNYLRHNRDRIVAGKKISRASTTHGGAARWQCGAK